MRRLLKFSYNPKGGEILVRYEVERPGDRVETITLESTDPPRTELAVALQLMAEHLCALAELPSAWASSVKVRGVTVTHTDDVEGLVITGLRGLQRSPTPLVVNTPHFTREPYGESSDGALFSARCGEALDKLTALVFAYVDGERAQLQFELVGAGAAAVAT